MCVAGNWFEDRAPKLGRGIVPDYGFRELRSSQREEFRRPNTYREARPGRSGPRFGMVAPETIEEARIA